jgi:hypothetical protein
MTYDWTANDIRIDPTAMMSVNFLTNGTKPYRKRPSSTSFFWQNFHGHVSQIFIYVFEIGKDELNGRDILVRVPVWTSYFSSPQRVPG